MLDKGIDREELLRRIRLIADPGQRLALFVRGRFKKEAIEEMRRLVMAESAIVFGEGQRSSCSTRFVHRPDTSVEHICSIRFRETKVGIAVGTILWLYGRDDVSSRSFIRELIERATTSDPSETGGFQDIDRVAQVFERFVPAEDPLRPAVERWLVSAWLVNGYYLSANYATFSGLDRKWLGREVPYLSRWGGSDDEKFTNSVENAERVLTAFVGRLQMLGSTQTEIARLLQSAYIQKQTSLSVLLAIATHPLFQANEAVHARTCEILLGGIADMLCSSRCSPFVFGQIARTIWGETPPAEVIPAFRDLVKNCFFWGRDTQVDQFLAHMAGPCGAGSLTLVSLAAETFDRAVQFGYFVRAADLVRVYGEDPCFDRDLLAAKITFQEGTEEYLDELAYLVEQRRTEIREAENLAAIAGNLF